MHLIDLLTPARVLAGVTISSKKRLLEQLSGLLSEGAGAEIERRVFDSLCGREKLGSTGLGHGVAIPHGRTSALPGAVGAFLRLAEPIDFSALDGQPVDLVFALAVPEHFSHQHLLLLSQLAEMFSDAAFCARLRTAPDNGALYALLADWQLAHAAA
ncbi:MAG: PTS IIA-like nitrogen regulatory protein PtsN [Chiayiivirga sp.]|jgi:PTS system nitrogen regulatory IIA component|uniref:PTS IIA-like nitrogen regulatory protein PtsN n=1 Tax=Chiayiivirga sp. TaxID=2041042 RepID=UPI0025BF0281|nr:PTS IIA-like nitrogen regulatory protein PtsN [Chiayiivirga sp.]MCI1709037.1 PTS IIA-like nitrogen regulatory protein PtsN [Chiayiivirga sp.]MCI1729349.1 PTS IIA-like nitrogen regulatory protein PtsN [Chiayiivirga sp.]